MYKYDVIITATIPADYVSGSACSSSSVTDSVKLLTSTMELLPLQHVEQLLSDLEANEQERSPSAA